MCVLVVGVVLTMWTQRQRKTSVTDLIKQVFKTIMDSRKVILKDLKIGPIFCQICFCFSQYAHLIFSITGLMTSGGLISKSGFEVQTNTFKSLVLQFCWGRGLTFSENGSSERDKAVQGKKPV